MRRHICENTGLKTIDIEEGRDRIKRKKQCFSRNDEFQEENENTVKSRGVGL